MHLQALQIFLYSNELLLYPIFFPHKTASIQLLLIALKLSFFSNFCIASLTHSLIRPKGNLSIHNANQSEKTMSEQERQSDGGGERKGKENFKLGQSSRMDVEEILMRLSHASKS